MDNQQMPWEVAAIFSVWLIGMGSVLLFFTDRLYDWQIRMLQAKWNRRFSKVMGFVFFVSGIVFVGAKLVSLLS